jgi:hypothetical protein
MSAASSIEASGTESPDQIDITPAMLEAGKEVLLRLMIDRDYLAVAPAEDELSTILVSVFSSMSDKSPRSLRKPKRLL